MTKPLTAFACLIALITSLAQADDCTPARYSLVFAINASPTGIAGYSQATVTACREGLSENDITNFRHQLADIHRKNNPQLTNDQVILLDFKMLRADPQSIKKQGLIVI